MKKVLIVIDNGYTGGVITSLYNYLQEASKIAECSLLAFNSESIDRNRLPANVKLLSAPPRISLLGYFSRELREQSSIRFLTKAALSVLARFVGGKTARKFLFWGQKKTEEYDLAISYAHDNGWNSLSKGCNDYVLYLARAKKKATFVHCDYQNFGGYHPKQLKEYKKFDYIINVSDSCKNNFVKMFPETESACVVCENLIPKDEIQKKAESAVSYPAESCNIVSVCRLDVEKGLLRALNAFARLNSEGYGNFLWTIVGDGPARQEIQQEISKNNLSDKVTLVGQKDNPYPYVKNADFFLLPSFHEAAPMVFGECQALGVTILSTKTCSAEELVKDRGLGHVCENSEEGIYGLLKDILQSGDFQQWKVAPRIHETNQIALQQLLAFMDKALN